MLVIRHDMNGSSGLVMYSIMFFSICLSEVCVTTDHFSRDSAELPGEMSLVTPF